MSGGPIAFSAAPQIPRQLFAGSPPPAEYAPPARAELAVAAALPDGDHYCGPNCPQHFFSITRNPASSGIDILA